MLKPTSAPHLRTLKPDEFLPSVSHWTTLGGLVLISGVGIALLLAAVLRYSITVKASAIVRPSGEVRLVQAETDGTVNQIEVEANQPVRQGDVIAVLNSDRLTTQKSQLDSNIEQTQVQLSQLDAQLALLDTQIAAESRSQQQEVLVAASELDRNQRDYRSQQTTTQADLAEAEATLTLANSEMRRYEQLVSSGAVSQLQFEEKQAAVRTAEAQVARARAALNPSAAPVAIAQQRIAQAQASGRAALSILNREREALIQRRSEIQAQLLRDQQDLQQTENELERQIIRATSDGVVLRSNLRNIDQVVRVGDTLVEIAPSNTALVVKALVLTQDISQVKLGQPVQLRINACPYTDYGTLQGTVITVAPDAIASGSAIGGTAPTSAVLPAPSNRPEPTNYYEVTVQPEQLRLTQGNRECQLQPGMEAEANIISRQETFLRFMLRRARLLVNL